MVGLSALQSTAGAAILFADNFGRADKRNFTDALIAANGMFSVFADVTGNRFPNPAPRFYLS